MTPVSHPLDILFFQSRNSELNNTNTLNALTNNTSNNTTNSDSNSNSNIDSPINLTNNVNQQQ